MSRSEGAHQKAKGKATKELGRAVSAKTDKTAIPGVPLRSTPGYDGPPLRGYSKPYFLILYINVANKRVTDA
jgi:hypothetical protein